MGAVAVGRCCGGIYGLMLKDEGAEDDRTLREPEQHRSAR